jgi:hypothetical protein
MPEAPDSIEAFRDTAATFCDLIEHVHEHTTEETIGRLLSLLPRLLQEATELPALEPLTDVEAPEIGHDLGSERFAAINAVLGEKSAYWTTIGVQAAPEPPDVVYWWVADDLADIWRDLSGGLQLLAAGGPVADVVWEWRCTFETHWGAHAIEALRALHAARHP